MDRGRSVQRQRLQFESRRAEVKEREEKGVEKIERGENEGIDSGQLDFK